MIRETPERAALFYQLVNGDARWAFLKSTRAQEMEASCESIILGYADAC